MERELQKYLENPILGGGHCRQNIDFSVVGGFVFGFVFEDFLVSMVKYGEGNGTPLQHSCLENPTDGGAWWAAIYGVA